MYLCFTSLRRPGGQTTGAPAWRLSGLSVLLCGFSVALAGCGRLNKVVTNPDVYVTAKQAFLRDRVAAVSNRTGEVSNGDKLTVLGRQRRFLHVKAANGAEGWIEEKLTADQTVADQFDKLRAQHLHDGVVASAVTRDEVYLHLSPGRDTVHFFRLSENDPLRLLERASVPKPVAPGAAASAERPTAAKLPVRESGSAHQHEATEAAAEQAAAGPPQPVMEDWWLAQDAKGNTGWVYAKMIDVSEPDALARYAEGQRIVGAYVLNYVDDPGSNFVSNGQPVTHIPEYVTVLSPFKAGLPYDFDQVRVFIWNVKKHRYETAYRERNIAGYLPVWVGAKTDPYNRDAHFAGALPTFITKVVPADAPIPVPDPATGLFKPARTTDDAIRLEGNVCRRIAPPNSPPLALAHPNPEPEKGEKGKGRRR